MRFNKKRLLLFAIVVAVVSIVPIFVVSSNEPSYGGHKLTYWLIRREKDAVSSPGEVTGDEFAIREIGTNAIPYLLKLALNRNSSVKEKVLSALPREWSFRLGFLSDYDKYELARDGMHVLGPIAKPAVLPLVAMLNNQNSDVRIAAVDLLASIGPSAEDAVPSLIVNFKGGDANLKTGIIIALGSIHADPESVIPFLIEQLNAPATSKVNRIAGFTALGEFGKEAVKAVPTIRQYLDDPDPPTRNYASNALGQIEPGLSNP